ncbi:DUF2358 family protein (DUF2358) [Wolffia australiana]
MAMEIVRPIFEISLLIIPMPAILSLAGAASLSPIGGDVRSSLGISTKFGGRQRARVSLPVRSIPVSTISPLPSLDERPKREGGGDKHEYYVNMGHAIRTLREDFPSVFYREPSFDIFREDVVFKDPINTFVGIDNYRRVFWALRLCGKLFFKALWLDVVSIWQPAENVVMIRWIVHGIPRVPWDSHGRFDGTSEYKLDRNGKIFEHKVDNIAVNSPPKFRVAQVEELIQAMGCPSTPGPTFCEGLPELERAEIFSPPPPPARGGRW